MIEFDSFFNRLYLDITLASFGSLKEYNMTSIEDRYHVVCDQVKTISKRCGRDQDEVMLLAVSKMFPADDIKKLAAIGCHQFAESYVQEACEKVDALSDLNITWHFIGPVQSNKTKDIATRFQWLHSLDRLKIARRLEEQRPDSLAPLNLCIQVNISEDPNKSGILLSEVDAFAAELETFSKLTLRGLMAVPALGLEVGELNSQFRQLSDKQQQLAKKYPQCDTLSLGMSADMKEAIEAGSTMVRVGSAIFGQRQKKN